MSKLSTLGEEVATLISGVYGFTAMDDFEDLTGTKILVLPSNYEVSRRSRCTNSKISYEVKILSKESDFETHVQTVEDTIDLLNSNPTVVAGSITYKIIEIQTSILINWDRLDNTKTVMTDIIVVLES